MLEQIAGMFGAVGALFFAGTRDVMSFTTSPGIRKITEAYVAEGWMLRGVRAHPLSLESYPGFRTETDFRPAAELEALPEYTEFVIPRGLIGGAGTMIQGVGDVAANFTVEGLGSHERARRALPMLDRLRPHIARAMSLSQNIARERTQLVVNSLQSAAIAAAVIGGGGALRAFNDLFVARLGDFISTRAGLLRFQSERANRQLAEALAAPTLGRAARSIPIRPGPGAAPFVMHFSPIPDAAQSRFDSDGLLVMLDDGTNASVPSAALLSGLFDLTPAEARVTRGLLTGQTIAQAAATLNVSVATARSQLKAVFGKTGVDRQAELVRLLAGFEER